MTLPIYTTYSSPNFNSRPAGVKPSSLVLHTTEGRWPSDIKWLCNPQTSGQYQPVSCHYVIAPTGGVYRIVADDKRAWHAGTGSYLGITDWNNASIGIEVSRKAGDPWPEAQMTSLRLLCLDLIATYGIEQSRIAAHRWIAPGRRKDPTDWPDPQMASWISGLYGEPDWAELWGTAVPYTPDFGIPVAWRGSYRQGKPLGQAITGELQAKDRVVQVFEQGYITYSAAAGVSVGMWT